MVHQKHDYTKEIMMNKINNLLTHYATPRNRKVLYILLTLLGLAIAGGAPGASSGIGGGLGMNSFFIGH